VPSGQVQEFIAEYAPRTETRSEPYVSYSMFTARYAVYRDLNTFDLRENRQLGPSLSLTGAYGSPELGADFRAFPLSAAASWTFGSGDALARASFGGGTRVRDGVAIDQIVQGRLYFASPIIRRALRVVASVEADAARNDTQHTRYALGGDTGLRGYVIGEFQGSSMAVAHLELRSLPLAAWSQCFGLLLFCDAGDAAASLYSLTLRTDVGGGLRWLIPQLNSYVVRVDWAVPLLNGLVTPAGFPGRLSAGFAQTF
jgi:Omp85 superfamily domain